MKRIILPLVFSIAITACENAPKKEESKEEQKIEKAFPLSNLDTTVSPCEDFYQYAIGGWLKNNPIPNTESRWSSFNVVNDSNNAKLKKILVEFSTNNFEKGSTEQKIGDFYKSIMDSTKAEELGIEPIKHLLQSVESAKTIDELLRLGADYSRIGVRAWYSLYIGQDDKKSDEYITYISQSGLGLPDQAYYTKTDEKSKEIQEAYKKHLNTILALIGDKNSEASAKKVYELERRMAEVSMTRVERRDPDKTYNKKSLSELRKLTSNINWEDHFETINLQGVENVVVSQPDYLKALNDLMKEFPLEDWKLYMKWKIIDTYASELNSDFVDANFDFYNRTLSGTKEMKPRWKRALRKINGK